MTQKVKYYPYSCPMCRQTSTIDMIDSDHDEDEYGESWQCDGCGTEWTCTFELVETKINEVEPI